MDEHERRLQAELMRKFEEMGLSALRQSAVAALTAHELQAVLDAMDWSGFIADWQEVSRILQKAGAAASVPTLSKIVARRRLAAASGRLSFPPEGNVEIAFHVVDQNVVQWADRHAAQLVVEIADDMRATIRENIVMAVNGGMTPQETARQLARIVPLHTRYANAVIRREQQLYLGGIRNGMTQNAARARAARMSETYARKLTRARARTIARTEIMTASNVGQHYGYQSAMDGGLMSNPGQGYRAITKEWITAQDERVCPVCGPLDQKQVDWSEAFPGGLVIPPAHPNCRCSYNVIDNLDQFDFDGAGTPEQEYADIL